MGGLHWRQAARGLRGPSQVHRADTCLRSHGVATRVAAWLLLAGWAHTEIEARNRFGHPTHKRATCCRTHRRVRSRHEGPPLGWGIILLLVVLQGALVVQ